MKSIEHEPHGRGYIRKEQCNFGWDWGPVLVTCGVPGDISARSRSGACLEQITTSQQIAEDGSATLTIQPHFAGTCTGVDAVTYTLRKDGVEVAKGTESAGDALVVLTLSAPELWWPNGFGKAHLYELEAVHERDGGVVGRIAKRIGFRTLELVCEPDEWGESFFFRVNGVPVFAKGSNWIPSDTLHRESEEHLRDLLQSAADSHQNMIRVWGGAIYEQDAFYDLCDELGLLVWQDFMFACSAYPAQDPDFQASVEAEVRDQALRLGDHPCLALWCGNNELEMFITEFQGGSWPGMPLDLYLKMFDGFIPEALHAVRPDALYWPCSPHSPGGNREWDADPDRGDAHLWDVWHGDQPFEWHRGSFHRFCSEFGFQSYPEMRTIHTYAEEKDLNITSPVMEFHQRSQVGNEKILRYMLSWYRMPNGFENTVRLSQLQQGMAIQYAVEHWRIHRPRCMGALYWQLNDCWPVASWASIDYYGRWKTLHYMAKRFFAPLMVAGVEDPETRSVTMHVVNDLPQETPVSVRWTITDLKGTEVESGMESLTAAGCASTPVGTVDCTQALKDLGDRNLLVWLELRVEDKVVSESISHFVRPKHMELEKVPVAAQVLEKDGVFQVTVSSDAAVLWVHLDLEKTDFRASDNDFCLRPGQPRTVEVKTAAPLTVAELEDQLQISSLVDTTL